MDNLPSTLDLFYDRILLDIDREDHTEAFLALQWLTYAARPITIEELAEAVIVQTKSIPYLNPADRFFSCNDILAILPAGLVVTSKISADSRPGAEMVIVQFAHFSVREYLTSRRISRSAASQFRIDEKLAHITIAEVCLAYLLHIGGQNTPVSIQLYKKFVLLQYAATCWQIHLRSLQGCETTENLDDLCCLFFNVSKGSWRLFLSFGYACKNYGYWRPDISEQCVEDPEIVHPVTVVSEMGLDYQLRILLAAGSDLAAVSASSQYSCPLHAAVSQGHAQVVKTLLASGADINQQMGELEGSALQLASYKRDADIVRVLLENNADVEAQDGHYGTALQAAAFGGSIEVVRLLLQKKADVNARGGHYGTALQAAVVSGQLDIVKLLIQYGADCKRVRRTIWHSATGSGKRRIS
jgi:hypothetical protein